MVTDVAACKGVAVKCGRADLPHCFFMKIYRGIGRRPSVFRKGRIAFGAFFGMSVCRSIGEAFDSFPSRNSARSHLFCEKCCVPRVGPATVFGESVGSLSGSFFGASVRRSIGGSIDTFPSRNSSQCHLFCEGCCVPRVGPETVSGKASFRLYFGRRCWKLLEITKRLRHRTFFGEKFGHSESFAYL